MATRPDLSRLAECRSRSRKPISFSGSGLRSCCGSCRPFEPGLALYRWRPVWDREAEAIRSSSAHVRELSFHTTLCCLSRPYHCCSCLLQPLHIFAGLRADSETETRPNYITRLPVLPDAASEAFESEPSWQERPVTLPHALLVSVASRRLFVLHSSLCQQLPALEELCGYHDPSNH